MLRGFTFKLIKRNYGKIRILIHCTVSNMFAYESTLVLWLSDLLSMDSHFVSEGVSRLSNIIFTATGTDDRDYLFGRSAFLLYVVYALVSDFLNLCKR